MGLGVRGIGRLVLPVVLSALCLPGVPGCGGSSPPVRMDPEDQLEFCRRTCEQGKPLTAIPSLQDLVLNYPGTPEGVEAQYLLGESYRRTEQYDLARKAYQDLVREYPNSTYRDEAQLKIGVTYFEESLPPEYDQEMTYKAMEEFEVFLADYPNSPVRGEAEDWLRMCREKLAKKMYLNGKLYLKMGYTAAARHTFQRILDRHPASESAAPAILGIARSYLREKKRTEAEAALDRLIDEFPGTPEARIGRDTLEDLRGRPEGQG